LTKLEDVHTPERLANVSTVGVEIVRSSRLHKALQSLGTIITCWLRILHSPCIQLNMYNCIKISQFSFYLHLLAMYFTFTLYSTQHV